MGDFEKQAEFSLPPPAPADRAWLKGVFAPGGKGRRAGGGGWRAGLAGAGGIACGRRAAGGGGGEFARARFAGTGFAGAGGRRIGCSLAGAEHGNVSPGVGPAIAGCGRRAVARLAAVPGLEGAGYPGDLRAGAAGEGALAGPDAARQRACGGGQGIRSGCIVRAAGGSGLRIRGGGAGERAGLATRRIARCVAVDGGLDPRGWNSSAIRWKASGASILPPSGRWRIFASCRFRRQRKNRTERRRWCRRTIFRRTHRSCGSIRMRCCTTSP